MVNSKTTYYPEIMAEAFGIAAGVAGFASLLGQFVSATNTLREIRRYAGKAPADLDAVVKDLEMISLTCRH